MMRTNLCVCVVAAWASFALSAEPEVAKPNTLTADQISSGWILLFDGETPFGWKAADAKVDRGMLKLGGMAPVTAETTTQFGDFELRFEYAAKSADQAAVVLNGAEYPLSKLSQPLTGGAAGSETGGWRAACVRVESSENAHKVSACQEGGPVATKPAPSRTTIGFRVPGGGELSLRSVRLKPAGMEPLFNGKNLEGWKVIPGHASKFTVTEKGELNIKDGGGEIQTEGQWADFVLQIDVISNGKHLNSGIFFRTIPDQFWQGYESQIRNQWEGDDRTKPVDYGTGGIYNRQKSRKVVSTDGEWFTKTLVAHGPHIAVWVNGYQAADYTDGDKDAPTARKGRYLGKGAISLQGHDPTTDLSFRNIKLAELPAEKKQD
jgi:hypothetical protein